MASGTGLFDQNRGRMGRARRWPRLSLTPAQYEPAGRPQTEGQSGPDPKEWAKALTALQTTYPGFPAVGRRSLLEHRAAGRWMQTRIAINIGTSGAMRVALFKADQCRHSSRLVLLQGRPGTAFSGRRRVRQRRQCLRLGKRNLAARQARSHVPPPGNDAAGQSRLDCFALLGRRTLPRLARRGQSDHHGHEFAHNPAGHFASVSGSHRLPLRRCPRFTSCPIPAGAGDCRVRRWPSA